MRVITLDTNKKVISVKNVADNYILQPNELCTDLGKLGQIQQQDGSFIDDTTPTQPQPPTLESRISSVEDLITALLGI